MVGKGVLLRKSVKQGGTGMIFLVGLPRSGSTLLASMLSSRQGVCDLGETHAMSQAFASLGSESDCVG